jgi:hypothetical protein
VGFVVGVARGGLDGLESIVVQLGNVARTKHGKERVRVESKQVYVNMSDYLREEKNLEKQHYKEEQTGKMVTRVGTFS